MKNNMINEITRIIFIIIIVISLLLSGFFSSAETVITSFSIHKVRNRQDRRKKTKNQKFLNVCKKVIEEYTTTITIILIFNTIFNVLIASLITVLFTTDQDGGIEPVAGVLYSTITTTVVVLVFAELLPKIISRKIVYPLLKFYVFPIHWLSFIAFPFTFLIKKVKKNKTKITVSEKELSEMVNIAGEEGVLEDKEKFLIQSAMRFDNVLIRNVMINLKNVKHLKINQSFEEVKEFMLKTPHSRIPVFSIENFKPVGVLYTKKFLRNCIDDKIVDWRKLISPHYTITERTKLDSALETFQRKRQHLAFVTKTKKKEVISGVVTIEDLLEELVGEIYDEEDKKNKISEIGLYVYQIQGSALVEKVFDNYIERIRIPKHSKISFSEWMCRQFKIKKWILNKTYIYKKLEIKIIKIAKNDNEVIFEVNNRANANLNVHW